MLIASMLFTPGRRARLGWARRLCLLPYQALQLAGDWPANRKVP